MRPGSFLRRRPSPALVISIAALFMSLGGVGYAATQLPNNSVSTSALQNGAVTTNKLRNNAVSFKKIAPSSVGYVRANTKQLQERVTQGCPLGFAIGVVNQSGSVSCNSARPSQFGTTNNTATVPNTATTVTSTSLPAGASYLALANPTASVTSGASPQHVTVTCTLTVGSNTETRTITVDTDGTSGDTSTASVPLQATGTAGTAAVSCQSSGSTPVVSVTSGLNAIQIAS